MREKALAALCLMFLLGFCASNVQARKWTDKSGKYSIDAEFVGLSDGQVTLKRSDGKTVRLALENLSKADQEQVRQLTSSVPKAKTDSQIQAARPATKTPAVSAKPDSKSKTFTQQEIRKATEGLRGSQWSLWSRHAGDGPPHPWEGHHVDQFRAVFFGGAGRSSDQESVSWAQVGHVLAGAWFRPWRSASQARFYYLQR